MRTKVFTVVATVLFFVLLLVSFRSFHTPEGGPLHLTGDDGFEEWPAAEDKVIVVAKMPGEDVDWIAENLPDWQRAIYHPDTPTSTYHTPLNKGREAMAYLTYIIDRYDKLPSTLVFIHPHRRGWPVAWHTEGSDHDAVIVLNSLRLDYVQESGYVNLRCTLSPGCPDEIRPFRNDEERPAERAFAGAWSYMFGDSGENDNSTVKVPDVVAEPCCAQFAVSRDRVRERKREEYMRYRQWLLETELEDDVSGRVVEYMWHVFFGRDPVYCPDVFGCYCRQFGWC